jgi:hypothetical protein
MDVGDRKRKEQHMAERTMITLIGWAGLAVVLAGCGGTEEDVCALAVQHLEACSGSALQQMPECDVDRARRVLGTECQDIARAGERGVSSLLGWLSPLDGWMENLQDPFSPASLEVGTSCGWVIDPYHPYDGMRFNCCHGNWLFHYVQFYPKSVCCPANVPPCDPNETAGCQCWANKSYPEGFPLY